MAAILRSKMIRVTMTMMMTKNMMMMKMKHVMIIDFLLSMAAILQLHDDQDHGDVDDADDDYQDEKVNGDDGSCP